MARRPLLFALVLVLLFMMGVTLSACGGGGEATTTAVTTAGSGAGAGSETSTTTEAVSTDTNKAATDFTTKTIKITIHAAAGGSADVPIRGLLPYLEKQLGVAVIAENVEGGGGRTARAQLYKAEPDGYLLGTLTVPSIYLGQALYEGQYDTSKFTYISNIGGNDYRTVIVKADSPIQNWGDLVELSKTKKIVIAQRRLGATAHCERDHKQTAGLLTTHPVKRQRSPGTGAGRACGRRSCVEFGLRAVLKGSSYHRHSFPWPYGGTAGSSLIRGTWLQRYGHSLPDRGRRPA